MAIAAATADDPTKSLNEKIEAVNQAIEYSKEWNQDFYPDWVSLLY